MEKKLPAYIRLVTALIGIVLVVFVMVAAKSILVPLLIAGMLAVLISPLASWLERHKIPKILATFLSLIALLGILGGLSIFFYNQLLGFADDLSVLNARMSELIGAVNELMERNVEGAVPISMDSIQNTVFRYLSENMATLGQGIIATATTLTIMFIIPVYIFLFLYYRTFLIQFLMKAFPDAHQERVRTVIHKVKGVVQNYISGMMIVILILAVLNSIALLSFGLKHALLFAVFAAMLNVIPFLGPFIGATLPILYALLTKDSLWYPIGVFLCFYFIQLAESNFFTPKIVGGKVSMNPLMTIIALFVGNFIWGLAGMILFIPGMAMLKVVFDEIPGMEAYGFLLGHAGERKRKSIKLPGVVSAVQKKIMKK
jgi:predicted PurR-regulated permease PerM